MFCGGVVHFFFFQNKDAYLLFHVTSTTMHNNSNTHTKSNNTSFKSAAYNFSTYVSVLVCVLSESFFFPLLSCFTFSTFFPSFFFTLLPAYSFFVCAFCISFLFFFLNNISERLYTFQFFFFCFRFIIRCFFPLFFFVVVFLLFYATMLTVTSVLFLSAFFLVLFARMKSEELIKKKKKRLKRSLTGIGGK